MHLAWCWNRGKTAKGCQEWAVPSQADDTWALASASALAPASGASTFSDSSMSGFERCRAVVSDIFLTRRVVGRRFPSVFPLPRCCSRHFRAAGRPRPVLLLLLLLLLLLVLVLVFPSVFPLPRCCSRQ